MGMTFYESEIARQIDSGALAGKMHDRLRVCKTYMRCHYGQSLSLADIAQQAFLSPSHFIKAFGRVYGVTPRQYLRDLRLDKAKQQLCRGQSVTEVCFSVGYTSLPSFSKQFKQAFGCSPKVYQQLQRRNLE